MKAKVRFHRKLTLLHGKTLEVAIAELKVTEIPLSIHCPEGFKFAMFLVLRESGEVLVGFDNHKPKGPHLHLRGSETAYHFEGIEKLVEDFWMLVKEEGFII